MFYHHLFFLPASCLDAINSTDSIGLRFTNQLTSHMITSPDHQKLRTFVLVVTKGQMCSAEVSWTRKHEWVTCQIKLLVQPQNLLSTSVSHSKLTLNYADHSVSFIRSCQQCAFIPRKINNEHEDRVIAFFCSHLWFLMIVKCFWQTQIIWIFHS